MGNLEDRAGGFGGFGSNGIDRADKYPDGRGGHPGLWQEIAGKLI